VDVMGDFLLLTWDRKEKSRPSRAMAKMIRGRGNMEPNRLGEEAWGGKHQLGTTVCRGTGRGTRGNEAWKEVRREEKGEELAEGGKICSVRRSVLISGCRTVEQQERAVRPKSLNIESGQNDPKATQGLKTQIWCSTCFLNF